MTELDERHFNEQLVILQTSYERLDASNLKRNIIFLFPCFYLFMHNVVISLLSQMDLHEAQQKGGGGGGPIGSPHEINNLKQQLQDTKKKLEASEKIIDEKTQLCNDLEKKLQVKNFQYYLKLSQVQCFFIHCVFLDFSNVTYQIQLVLTTFDVCFENFKKYWV